MPKYGKYDFSDGATLHRKAGSDWLKDKKDKTRKYEAGMLNQESGLSQQSVKPIIGKT